VDLRRDLDLHESIHRRSIRQAYCQTKGGENECQRRDARRTTAPGVESTTLGGRAEAGPRENTSRKLGKGGAVTANH